MSNTKEKARGPKFTLRTRHWKNCLVDRKCMDALLQDTTFYHLCEELGSAKEAKKAMKDADKKKTKGVMKKDNINADIREVVKK
jgi:hypothetical protein